MPSQPVWLSQGNGNAEEEEGEEEEEEKEEEEAKILFVSKMNWTVYSMIMQSVVWNAFALCDCV